MTSQQQADFDLAQWQSLRALPPEIRIEHLMSDFFQPPLDLDCRYEDQMRAVTREMADV